MSSILKLSVFLAAVACFVFGSEEKFDGNHPIIRTELATYTANIQNSKSTLCTTYNCCTVSATQTCAYSSLPSTGSSLIFPGGSTTCLDSAATPYAFQVFPGDYNNLLFYFQGGGGCFTSNSTCTTDVSPQPAFGVFDKTNAANPYKTYTIVHVIYCSGDLHAGNIQAGFFDSRGLYAQQRGLVNTHAVLSWVAAQSASGALASVFSNIVISGCSAGSYAAQFWMKPILDTLKWQHAAVISDSFIGYGPGSSFQVLTNLLGYCNSDIITTEQAYACQRYSLTYPQVIAANAKAYPAVPLVFIQSKVDGTQQYFYNLVAQTLKYPTVTPAQFYEGVANYTRTLVQVANAVTYFIDGMQHCYTPTPYFYTANTYSRSGGSDSTTLPAQTSTQTLVDFVSQFPLAAGETAASQCQGFVGKTSATDFTYCSPDIITSYTQPAVGDGLHQPTYSPTGSPKDPYPASSIAAIVVSIGGALIIVLAYLIYTFASKSTFGVTSDSINLNSSADQTQPAEGV